MVAVQQHIRGETLSDFLKIPQPRILRKTTEMVDSATQSGTVSDFFFGIILKFVFALLAVVKFVRSFYFQSTYRVEALTLSPHKTPQIIRNDVTKLSKVPRHIAVILDRKQKHVEGGGVEGQLSDVGEVAAWCIGAGASELTVYERTGVLKSLPLQDVYNAIEDRLRMYFGNSSSATFKIFNRQNDGTKSLGPSAAGSADPKLLINLISESNGRKLIVDVTRVLSDMVAQNVTSPKDITLDVIDRQLKERIGSEPDLLIMFSSEIDLQGYPPWHIRVTEIYCSPANNGNVSYLVFMKALHAFATAKFKLGR